jgi:quinol monooxygenase YgiN
VILVIGWVRLAPEDVATALPAAQAMMAASQAEDGCFEYAYSEDLSEPGMIRVAERWRDFAALDAHFRTPHMAAWREALSKVRLLERKVSAFEVAGERAL